MESTKKPRRRRCGACSPCRRPNCGLCKYCRDLQKSADQRTLKQACSERRCVKLNTGVPKSGSGRERRLFKEGGDAAGQPEEANGTAVVNGKDLAEGIEKEKELVDGDPIESPKDAGRERRWFEETDDGGGASGRERRSFTEGGDAAGEPGEVNGTAVVNGKDLAEGIEKEKELADGDPIESPKDAGRERRCFAEGGDAPAVVNGKELAEGIEKELLDGDPIYRPGSVDGEDSKKCSSSETPAVPGVFRFTKWSGEPYTGPPIIWPVVRPANAGAPSSADVSKIVEDVGRIRLAPEASTTPASTTSASLPDEDESVPDEDESVPDEDSESLLPDEDSHIEETTVKPIDPPSANCPIT